MKSDVLILAIAMSLTGCAKPPQPKPTGSVSELMRGIPLTGTASATTSTLKLNELCTFDGKMWWKAREDGTCFSKDGLDAAREIVRRYGQ